MPVTPATTRRATPLALVRRMAEHAHQLRAEFGDNPNADSLAQSIACAAPILAAAEVDHSAGLDWLASQLQPWEQTALEQSLVLSTQYSVLSALQHTSINALTPHSYDTFLDSYSKDNRKRGGVFFTPPPIADYIVANIDRLLREECGFANGLADDRVTIIDPACGTGIFLLAIINFLHARSSNNHWLPSLLSRLIGIEILPPAAFLAKLNIALKLTEISYDFQDAHSIQILTGDALCPVINSAFSIQNSAFPVLIGNPPFSSLSTNSNEWISRLVRGDEEIRGYVRANGQELGERKTWLHDDYVKFIRLAQWHVEEAGGGIVGYVTNHGYLDNATFRLMRHELLRVFPHIEIVDLHGNRKKHEISPDGSPDENVFGLDQGIALSLLCRPPTLARSASKSSTLSTIKYSELWSTRNQKLDVLAAATRQTKQPRFPSVALRASVLNPQAPSWQLVPSTATASCAEYSSAWSLEDAMPVNTTAPVTARDHFVVAFSREELISRIEAFCDLSISDDVIRQRYFQRTRSARYETGDTRGWKLGEARRIVAADANWQRHIVRCLYRPFDWRFVFWHPAMIDWPRTEVSRHLLHRDPLCLIARRQQLPTQPCTFFWISDGLALDGVIRSDNRGSESLFPLYLSADSQQANFVPGFVEQFATVTRLNWQPLGSGDLVAAFGPEDLLAYIYALFHSPSYREKYAGELRGAFPKVLAPKSADEFARLSKFGIELIQLHLLRSTNSVSNTHSVPDTLREDLESFRAGGYLALKKWLQPQHRSTSNADYTRIVAAIARTMEIMSQIDR